jgi:polysaccharide export outer membrane protein
MMIWRSGPIFLLAGALASCSSYLPADGPQRVAVVAGATESLSDRSRVAVDYVLVDINMNVLEHQVEAGPGSFFRTFGSGKGPAPEIKVGVGDILVVSIFESSAGGLFIPAEAGVRPGNFVTLPAQTVDRSGNISVPFAGQIKAAGQTLAEIQRDIEAKLANRAIEPQVIVAFQEQRATEVAVFGDVVNAANKFIIRQGGERILDMISRAGGIKYPGYETYVTLQRAGHRATVYFPTLVNNPAENIYVVPGDAIYLYREQQKFVAVGAVGTSGQTFGLTSQFSFDQERLSLNEAIARAGGLIDARANPTAVFLYRVEFREALQNMGLDLSAFPSDQKLVPTVYRANFRDPSAFFYSQKFAMRNRDIIYVANAESVEVGKFLTHVRTITSTISGVATDVVVTTDAGAGRHVLSKD